MISNELYNVYPSRHSKCLESFEPNDYNFHYSKLQRLEQIKKENRINNNQREVVGFHEKEEKWKLDDLLKKSRFRQELIPEIQARLKNNEIQKCKFKKQRERNKETVLNEHLRNLSLDYKFDNDTLFVIHKDGQGMMNDDVGRINYEFAKIPLPYRIRNNGVKYNVLELQKK